MDLPFLAVPLFKQSRLASLYSDYLRLRELNPEGYRANINAWTELLYASLKFHTFGSSIELPGDKLAFKLRNSTHGEPQLLTLVLDEQIREGNLIPWSIYKVHNVKLQKLLMNYLSPKKIANEVWNSFKISIYSLASNGMADHFLSWTALQQVGDSVYCKLEKRTNQESGLSANLFDSALFADLLKQIDPHLSDVDVQVLLIYFSRDTGRIAIIMGDPGYVKLGTTDPITEEEIGVIKLKASIRDVDRRMLLLDQKLNVDIPQRLARLVQMKATEDRLRNVLFRKASLKKSLSQTSAVHVQLTLILDKIDESHSNAELLETLKNAKKVLSSLNSQISIEEVDAVTADLDEEMAITSCVATALAPTPEDHEEIEQELLLLERDAAKNYSTENLISRLKNLNMQLSETTVDSVEKTSERAAGRDENSNEKDEKLDKKSVARIEKTKQLDETPERTKNEMLPA